MPCDAVDEKNIEAAVRIAAPGHVEPRGGEQAGALRHGHALRCAAVIGALAHADFGKHQRAALLGDKIDLSEPAAPVSLEQPQACCPQQARTKILGSRPSPVHGRLNETVPAAVDRMIPGILYVVATPIGNLADASPRAVEALRAADLIACEDTRTTRTLLARHAISARTFALHEHNERAAAAKLLEALRAGKNVALVSDAGTPALSDPGAMLVEQAHRAGIRVTPVPGPSAAVAAFSASGFAAERFLFAGFLPARRAARRKALEGLDLPWPVILYEAPHRVLETMEDLVARFGAAREVVIARELTKKFEELARLPLGEARAWLLADTHRQQGEFVLVLAPGEPQPAQTLEAERVLEALLEALAPSEAARLAARITGIPRSVLYRKAIERAK